MIREIKQDDYPEIITWFLDRKWPQPPIEGIGPNIGWVDEREDGELLSCAFTYTTGTSLAIIEWTGTNPELSESQTMPSLISVFDHIKRCCELSDPKIRALIMFTQNDALASRLKEKGFSKTPGFMRLIWSLK